MEENEEFDSDFNTEDIPISEEFWNYMENYWHNNREFPESTEESLSKKADLVDGKVPSSQLPSYVDDVLEFDTFDNLPSFGEKGKIYVITNNNTQFRWSGSEYIKLSSGENVVTTNTNQDIIGRKSFITAGGNGYNNNSLRLLSNDGSNPGLTFYKGGIDIANIYFDGNGNFKFRSADDTASRYVFAQGFKKDGSDVNYFLTGEGGHVLRSTYPTTTQADAKYIPYFGATANINLNAKPIANAGSIDATIFKNVNSSVLVKSFSLHNSTTVTSLGIKLTNSGSSIMMGSFTVTMFGYVGQTISFRVSMYKYNNTWFNPTVTWLHGDSSKISNIEFYKEDNSNLHLKVNFTTNFGAYNKTVITDVLANGQSEALHNPDTYTISVNPDNSAHTLVQTTSSIGFIRDNVGDTPKTPISLGTSDLNTILTPSFYNQIASGNATVARNYPALFGGSLNVYRSITGGVIQEYTLYHTGITYRRVFNSVLWTSWAQVIDSINGGTISADLIVSKNPEGNISIGTGGAAGTTGTPKYSNLNFLGYSNNTIAKISSADSSGSTVLAPLIFYTRNSSTVLQESMRIDGNGNIKAPTFSGTGTRMVIADATGTLSTQSIPDVTGYLPLTGGQLTGALTIRPASGGGTFEQDVITFHDSGTADGNIIPLAFKYGTSTNPTAFIKAVGKGSSGVNGATFQFFDNNTKHTEISSSGITTIGNINTNIGELIIQKQGVNKIRTGGTNGDSLILSSTSAIYLRPQGDTVTTGEVLINSSGNIITTSYGNASQWNNVYQDNLTNPFFNRGSIISRALNSVSTSLDAELPNGGFLTSYYSSSWAGSDRPTGASYGGYIKFKSQGSASFPLDLDFYYNNGHGGSDLHRLWFRTKNSTVGTTNWFEIATQNWTTAQLANYVTQSSLTGYAKLADNQTFTGDNTFSQSPTIPDGTLINHAVSLGQMTDYVDINSSSILNNVAANYIPNTHMVNGITSTNIANWNSAFNFTNNFATNYNDLLAIEALAGTNGYLRKDGNGQWSLVSSPVVDATATIAGKVKLGSDTIQTVASNFVTATIGKTYSVQTNSSGQLVVNVGWSDTNTTYTGSNGITLTGTNFTPTYGTAANTVAQGNDSRINNGQTAFGWGNHATAGYTTQSWVQSQNYATSNFVEERIDKLTGEIVDPTPSFSIKNKFTTVIITENYSKEPLELEGELIPGRYISIINLTGSKIDLTRDHNTIDTIYENETSEYYITKEKKLVRKGTYKSAKTLI